VFHQSEDTRAASVRVSPDTHPGGDGAFKQRQWIGAEVITIILSCGFHEVVVAVLLELMTNPIFSLQMVYDLMISLLLQTILHYVDIICAYFPHPLQEHTSAWTGVTDDDHTTRAGSA
jgi:uncharacterized membrane protein